MSMRSKSKVLGVLALLLSSTTAIAISTDVANSASVTPTIVNSNIDCTQLTPALPNQVQVTPGAIAGTYALPASGGGTATIAPNDNFTFTWSSTYPLDAVIVFGGSSANVYKYSNATGDTVLSAPKKNGKIPAISHVWFCHDGLVPLTLTAGKTTVKGARGVALSDIPISTLNVNDPQTLAQVYAQLAGSPVLKSSPALKSSPVLRSSPAL